MQCHQDDVTPAVGLPPGSECGQTGRPAGARDGGGGGGARLAGQKTRQAVAVVATCEAGICSQIQFNGCDVDDTELTPVVNLVLMR